MKLSEKSVSPAFLAHPDRPLVYTSSFIIERRRRLLREVRRMIVEDGIEQFSVRKLCLRAEVAQRTLYNAFHSKDRVIAIAIREAYDEMIAKVRYHTAPDSLLGVLDRTLSVNRGNISAPNYVRAIASIYFNQGTSVDIWDAIREMSVGSIKPWLDRVSGSGELNEWVDPDTFATGVANQHYAIINDWCVGRMPDNEFLEKLFTMTLILVIGATKGAARKEAEKFFSDFRRTGKLPSFPMPALLASSEA